MIRQQANSGEGGSYLDSRMNIQLKSLAAAELCARGADKHYDLSNIRRTPRPPYRNNEECLVSLLYEMKMRVEEKIKADNLDAMAVKGKLGLKTGMLIALISANTPDKPESIAKFKSAAKEILNLNL